METRPPAEMLKPYICRYMVIETDGEVVNRVLPGTAITLAFRFKGQTQYINGALETRLPLMVLGGLRKSARLINYKENTGTIVVQFKETGAGLFFNHPLYELYEQSLPLDNFITHRIYDEIEEKLSAAVTNKQRIAIIEQFLISKLQYSRPDRLVLAAVEKISLASGAIKISQLAADFNTSQDVFEKRFRKAVGATPKQFSSIVRMKNIISGVKQTNAFSEMALEAGFYDQSHFNKEFKIFTGLSPTAFFKSGRYW